MKWFKECFDFDGKRLVEKDAKVVIDEDYRTRRVRRSVYENGKGEKFVYFDGEVYTVEPAIGFYTSFN